MVKILINTTPSILNLDIGTSIPASGQITLQPTDFLEAADNDQLVELIGDGTIIVSDGNENLSKAQGMALLQSGFRKTDFDDSLLTSNRLKVDVTGTLSDGRVKVSNADTTVEFLEDKIVAGSNKLSKTIINAGSVEALQIDVNPSNINTSDLNNNANFIDSDSAPVQPSDISNFETSSQLNTRDTLNRNRSNHTGTQLASTISDFTSAVQSSETVTNLTFNNTTKVLTFTNEAGTAQNVDLTQFLDDTNLAFIVSGTLDAVTGIATFTRDDGSTFTLDMSSLNDQAAISSAISTHEVSITNHNDVNTSGASNGDFLSYNGTQWTPIALSGFKDFITTESGRVNNTTTLSNYLTLNSSIPTTGNYKISWSYEWSYNAGANDFIAQIEVNNLTNIMNHRQEPKDSAGTGISLPNTTGGNTNTGTNQRHNHSGFKIITLTAGTNVIDLDFRCEVGGQEAAIYRGTLSIESWD